MQVGTKCGYGQNAYINNEGTQLRADVLAYRSGTCSGKRLNPHLLDFVFTSAF
jgi:hypothetical protein